jgi:hypothetical protein
MKTIYKKTLFSLGFVSLFLAASIAPAHATGLSVGKAIGQAVLHKVVSVPNLPLLGSPLDANKLFVIVPEPNSGVLFAVGGSVVVAALWLRRRFAQKAIASARK